MGINAEYMGTCKLTMASISLPSCLLLALSFLVSGVPARYSPGDYKPDIGDGPPTDYGRPVKPNCHLEQKTTFQDRCEDYDEKTCWTQNEEHCSSYLVNTCTPVVNTGVDRRCFNVTELICELVESSTARWRRTSTCRAATPLRTVSAT